MKFWRPGITGKLFLAIFATCIVLLITMHWAVRVSFERGFIDYIKHGNEQRLQDLSDALSEQYAQHGNWRFLRNNDRLIFQILRSFERDNDHEDDHAGMPERGMQRDRAGQGRSVEGSGQPGRPGWGRQPVRRGMENDDPPPGPPGPPPPRGWRTQFWVVDQDMTMRPGWPARHGAGRRHPPGDYGEPENGGLGDRLPGGAPDAQHRHQL